jgi:heme-degrading monooxygenase HmoA
MLSTEEADTMVVARMSLWKFKKGQREAAFSFLNRAFGEDARKTRGFRGSIDLTSSEDPNSGVIITLWEDDKAQEASAGGLFMKAAKELETYIEAPPEVRNYRVGYTELHI